MEMRCENCGDREAEIHLTQIEEGEMNTVHLCATCAAEKGLGGAGGKVPLADFLAQLGEGEEEAALGSAADACPYCGTAPADFRRTGRLGCSQCYVHFSPQIRGLLRRIHGGTQHMGKVYLGQDAADDPEGRLSTLRRRLERAVEIEDFETAARLRDEIHELEGAT